VIRACPFCALPSECIWFSTDVAMVVFDAYPISEGHVLVIPKRHVVSLFDLHIHEQRDLWTVVALARERLAKELRPDAFNIGINDGGAAGQTVGHAHIHVIPRRKGDVLDPRGGMRWIIPEKAKYW
jgi:diadenosine tetraphosphate (Ap4A) HIT family hydrolase